MDNFYDVDRKWASPLWKTSSRHWCEVSRTKAGLKYTHLKWNGLTKKQPIPVNWMPFWIIQFNLCLEYNISSTVYEYANQTLPKYYHLTQCYYKNKSNLHMQKDGTGQKRDAWQSVDCERWKVIWKTVRMEVERVDYAVSWRCQAWLGWHRSVAL